MAVLYAEEGEIFNMKEGKLNFRATQENGEDVKAGPGPSCDNR